MRGALTGDGDRDTGGFEGRRCAYVPLDPDYPGERLALYAGRQRASGVVDPERLCRNGSESLIPDANSCPLVVLDARSLG